MGGDKNDERFIGEIHRGTFISVARCSKETMRATICGKNAIASRDESRLENLWGPRLGPDSAYSRYDSASGFLPGASAVPDDVTRTARIQRERALRVYATRDKSRLEPAV